MTTIPAPGTTGWDATILVARFRILFRIVFRKTMCRCRFHPSTRLGA